MAPTTVHLITPIITPGIRRMEDLAHLTSPEFVITNSILDDGPKSIQTPDDEEAAIPGIVKRAIEAEKAGAKALIVDCFGDPGVLDARKKVQIPVYGPGETTMREANKNGKYSVVTVVDTAVPMINALAKHCSVHDNLVSIEVINIEVLAIETDLNATVKALGEKSVEAMKKGAKTIVLGCTGFFDLDKKIKQILVNNGFPDVQVLDPIPTTVLAVKADLNA